MTIRELQERVPSHPLLAETIRLMRVRHMAYRTEEAYVGWLRRFEGFCRARKDLDAVGEEDLKAFLSHLAVEEPVSVGDDLRAHLESVREIHERDRAERRPGVYLPEALERKMPKAGERWAWFWVFPADGLSRDPRGDPRALNRRHHVLPGLYQKALWKAARVADIPKRANSHALRHSFATHLLEDGVNIRTLQEFLGHAQVETTKTYLRVMEDQRDRVRSPLDAVA